MSAVTNKDLVAAKSVLGNLKAQHDLNNSFTREYFLWKPFGMRASANLS